MKPFLHVYWTVLGALLRLGGAPFLAEPAPEELRWRQLVVISMEMNLLLQIDVHRRLHSRAWLKHLVNRRRGNR